MKAELPQHSPTLQQQAAYWRHRLSGELPVLELPFDHPRPPVSSFMREKEQRVLGEKMYQKLKGFCAQRNISVFVVLLAALKILLARYTGEKDVIVGWVPIGLQYLGTHEEDENEGSTNPVVLRTDLSDDPMVGVMLNRVADTVREAVVNRQHPFQTVVQEVGRDNLSRSLPFSVMFDMEDLIEGFLTARRAEAPSPLFQEYRVQCDFILNIFTNEQFIVQVEYDAELFEPATMRRLATHYHTLLEGLVDDPTPAGSHLPMLTNDEQNQLLFEWNTTTKHYPDNQCIHELVEAQVEHTPHHVAVVCDGKTLTYQKLNQKANQLAKRLQEQGVGRGDFIAVLMERGLDLVIAYLAIMKTGAAFSPLDPSWPLTKITEIFTQLHSKVILVADATPLFPDLAKWSLMIVDESQLLAHGSNLQIPVTLDDPIYIIFTSGSTGKPKGAINQHRGIVNRFFNMNDRYQCGEEDTILLTSPHVFDGSVYQIFWPLINGARTIIPSPTKSFDLDLIVNLIDQEQVTITDFVPSVFHLLVEYLTNNPQALPHLMSLRQLLIGGEALQAAPISKFKSMFSGIGITNDYGPTETSIGVIFFEVPEDCPDPIPIGRPLNNVYTLILDPNLNLVPLGIQGDLYLGGACVGLGYLNNSIATGSVFIPNPFPEIKSQKLYKTGDKARYLLDGNIQFLGRADHQVKIRGIRVELGEIERALNEHPEVKDSVVLAREDHRGSNYLIGYIVSQQDSVPTTVGLYHFLKQKLPGSMVPSTFVFIEAFPLTSNGKLNRQALPVPDQTHRAKITAYVSPRTPLEELVAEIWGDLLKVDQIGMNENFFALGGHSLLATQVVARLRNVLELDIPLRTLFEHPTVAQLAREIETKLANAFPDWLKDEL